MKIPKSLLARALFELSPDLDFDDFQSARSFRVENCLRKKVSRHGPLLNSNTRTVRSPVQKCYDTFRRHASAVKEFFLELKLDTPLNETPKTGLSQSALENVKDTYAPIAADGGNDASFDDNLETKKADNDDFERRKMCLEWEDDFLFAESVVPEVDDLLKSKTLSIEIRFQVRIV